MMSDFKCKVCGGSGWIEHYDQDNNHTYVTECLCQEIKRQNQRLKQSGIDVKEYKTKTFESFKTYDDSTRKMKEIALEFLKDKNATGLGFFGKSGMGKTHICIATCYELLKKLHKSHLYFPYRKEMDKARSMRFNFLEFEKWQNEVMAKDILFIDDLLKCVGNVWQIDSWELGLIFNIINDRYINKRVTIFSSELSVNKIIKIDEALGSRIYSIVNPYGCKCDGQNYRLKDIKKEKV